MSFTLPYGLSADPFQALKPGTNYVVAYTGSAGSQALTDAGVVRLVATTLCHINFEGTATSSSTPLPALVPEYFRVPAGTTISVIQNASGGNLHITVME